MVWSLRVTRYLKKSSEIWPNHPCCIIAASLNFITNKNETVEKFVHVHKKALEWMSNSSNHDDLINIAKRYTHIDSNSVIEIALDNIGYIFNYSFFTFWNSILE